MKISTVGLLAALMALHGAAWSYPYKTGNERLESKDYEGALAAYQEQIAASPGGLYEMFSHRQIGLVYSQTNRQAQAVAEYDEALRMLDSRQVLKELSYSSVTPVQMRQQLLQLKTGVLVDLGQYEQAIAVLEQAQQTGSDQKEAIARLKKRIAQQETAAQAKTYALDAAAAAEKAGKNREALKYYQEALASQQNPDPQVLEKIVGLARGLKPPPAISEEARRRAIRARVALKEATDNASYDQAINEYFSAIQLAPWWGDLYFNLAVLQEKRGRFREAIISLKLYQSAEPASQDARKVKDKIYELEYKLERQGKQAPSPG